MKQTIFKALLIGLVIVVSARLLGSPVLGRLMLPGILLGSLAPDAHWSWKGDGHPWGPISTVIAYTVNIVLYSGLGYGLLSLIDSWRNQSRKSDCP
jgi:hypothetical protein